MRIAALVLFLIACKSDKPATTNPIGSGSAVQPEPEPKPDPEPVVYKVDLAPFDKACTTVADCAMVDVYPCNKRCGCAQNSIAAKDLVKFREAAQAIQCPEEDPTHRIVCGSCLEPEPACVDGACTTKME